MTISFTEWLIKKLGGFTVRELDTAIANVEVLAIDKERDRLSREIFERGGYATIQLSEAGKLPRMKFIEPNETQKTQSLKLSSGVLIVRDGS